MPSSFPRASLNRYTPKFSGEAQKLTWCQQFGIQIFPKKVMPIFVAVFSVLLDLISSPGQTVDLRLQHVIHIWKAYASAVNFSYQETILWHPTRRQIFAGKKDSIFYNIWDLLIFSCCAFPLSFLALAPFLWEHKDPLNSIPWIFLQYMKTIIQLRWLLANNFKADLSLSP